MATGIVVVGAADTGRAPMTAALLRRRLAEGGVVVPVESAGVIGHDGDPPTAEAVATMEQMELDIAGHLARTLTDEIAAGAALVLAVDAGSARVAKLRFPEAAGRIVTLGELAGRQRDIPDPFKMQIGAWLAYAREIDTLIAAALPRILSYLPEDVRSPDAPARAPAREPAAPQAPVERVAAAGRVGQLLSLAAQMPGVVDWPAARARIEADLTVIAALPASPADLVSAYAGLMRAALALTPTPPSPGKLAALAEAAARLAAPLGQEEINALSGKIGGWLAL